MAPRCGVAGWRSLRLGEAQPQDGLPRAAVVAVGVVRAHPGGVAGIGDAEEGQPGADQFEHHQMTVVKVWTGASQL